MLPKGQMARVAKILVVNTVLQRHWFAPKQHANRYQCDCCEMRNRPYDMFLSVSGIDEDDWSLTNWICLACLAAWFTKKFTEGEARNA